MKTKSVAKETAISSSSGSFEGSALWMFVMEWNFLKTDFFSIHNLGNWFKET